MQTGKTTIRDIFDGTIVFNVPIYQRTYSWEIENLSDFLSDLFNQQVERPYFLGSFLFHQKSQRGDYKIIDIVDGQQRLTTLIIFINEVLLKLKKHNSDSVSKKSFRIYIKDDDFFKLELSNEDSSFLHDYILSDAQNISPVTKTPSQSKLLEAKKYFEAELEKLSKEDLERIFQISTGADALLYVVNEITQATQIFELLNDRGRKLTDLESIKSFLMYTVGVITKYPEQIIDTIQNNFADIYRIIERNKLNEEEILRYHTIAFEETTENPKKHIKKKVKSLLKGENTNISIVDIIKNYSSNLKNSFEYYEQINQEKYNNKELTKFFMLGKVGPFYPLLFKIYHDDKSLLESILKNLNEFNFKAIVVGLRGKLERDIYNYFWKNGLEGIDNHLKIVNDAGWWDINRRASRTLETNYYYGAINHNILKYILVTYENSLRFKKGFPQIGLKEYFSEIEREKFSIEHITAQKSEIEGFNQEFKDSYLNNIGNLVLDCKASNSSKGKKNGDLKSGYFQHAPIISQNMINDYDCNWNDLNAIKIFISKREIVIKKFIAEELLKVKLLKNA